MNPEQRKNHRGGPGTEAGESPAGKETKREKKPGRPRTKSRRFCWGCILP